LEDNISFYLLEENLGENIKEQKSDMWKEKEIKQRLKQKSFKKVHIRRKYTYSRSKWCNWGITTYWRTYRERGGGEFWKGGNEDFESLNMKQLEDFSQKYCLKNTVLFNMSKLTRVALWSRYKKHFRNDVHFFSWIFIHLFIYLQL
jgi:hypothetical protein